MQQAAHLGGGPSAVAVPASLTVPDRHAGAFSMRLLHASSCYLWGSICLAYITALVLPATSVVSCRVAAVKGAPSAVALQQYKVLEDAQPLFQPLQIGNLQLQHRIVMAPLTRNRWATAVHFASMQRLALTRCLCASTIALQVTCCRGCCVDASHSAHAHAALHASLQISLVQVYKALQLFKQTPLK